MHYTCNGRTYCCDGWDLTAIADCVWAYDEL